VCVSVYIRAYICVCIYTALERDLRLTSSGFDIRPVQVLMQVVCVCVREYIYIHAYIYMCCIYIKVNVCIYVLRPTAIRD